MAIPIEAPSRRRRPWSLLGAVSLRARLGLTVALVALVALGVADLVTYHSLEGSLFAEVDTTLQRAHIPIERLLSPGDPVSSKAPQSSPGESGAGDGGAGESRSAAPAVAGSGGAAPAGAESEELPSGQQFCALSSESGDAPGAFIELRTRAGAVVDGYRCSGFEAGAENISPALPRTITGFVPESLEHPELATYFTAPSATAGGPSFRVRASVLSAGPFRGDVLVLAESLHTTENTLHSLLATELAVGGAAIAAALVLGWWLVFFELASLRRVEATAGEIAGGDLSHRVPVGNSRTEVGRVADALNSMLATIEHAFAERDATEEELRASEERLRRFVGNASHELRTPIAAVSAYAQLLARGAAAEDVPRIIDGIRAESARMAQLVEDLLTLARLDEHGPLRIEPVELVDLVASCMETARTVGPGWPLSLEASEAVEVLGDGAQLRQVVTNLLANVRAHTPEGTPATVRVRREGEDAVIEVADRGPGMTSEQAARVFERFFRADPSRARATGGSGLGLAIVAAIVSAHDGSVSVSAALGEGATFTVRLPRAPDEEPGASLPR